jgi:hypothetical protein
MKQRVFWSLVIVLAFRSEAHAQFGMGGFGGMGGFFAPYVSPTQMVQDRRPITQNVGGPVSRPVEKRNAYWDNLREPMPTSYSMTPRRDIRRGSRAVDRPSQPRQAAPVQAPAPARASDPKTVFLGFFGADDLLVWPKDSPLEGDLSGKRASVDSAMASLRTELVSTKTPSVANVVNSRNQLLGYGRPALADLRQHNPTQADEFHAWLLGLYNALGNLVQQ